MNPSCSLSRGRAALVCLLMTAAVVGAGCDSATTKAPGGTGTDRSRSIRDRVAEGYAAVFGGTQLEPIKGVSIGMPIEDAVAVMNAQAGPIWAATLGKPEVTPFKVVRIAGAEMQQIRLQIIQLVSIATMQLYRVDPADMRDIFIVVPSTAAERPNDLAEAGLNVLQSVLFTGFFAWADEDGKVKLFIIGPTLSNALFDAAFMPMNEFADRFKSAYGVPGWEKSGAEGTGMAFVHESVGGHSVVLAEDVLQRRTVLVWDSRQPVEAAAPGKGDFR